MNLYQSQGGQGLILSIKFELFDIISYLKKIDKIKNNLICVEAAKILP
jgi:hypothetical protein